MNLRKYGVGLAAATIAVLALPVASAQAQTAFAIGNDRTSLIRFDLLTPGAAVVVADFTGATTNLDNLDFRPLTGMLYGYSDFTDTLYTVNIVTGVTTAVGAGGGNTGSGVLGLDFNPDIDRVRVITNDTTGLANNNVVFNPVTGAVTAVAPIVAYAAGDVNAGVDALIADNAYQNNVDGLAGVNQQYGIDYGTNSLVRINNATGVLNTVGLLSLGGVTQDITEFSGFDIFTTATNMDTGFVLFGDGALSPVTNLFTVDLTSGALMARGGFNTGVVGTVRGIAVTPTPSVAPEPGTFALAALGLGLVGVVRTRRRKGSLAA